MFAVEFALKEGVSISGLPGRNAVVLDLPATVVHLATEPARVRKSTAMLRHFVADKGGFFDET